MPNVLLAIDPTDDIDALREVLVSMGYEVIVAKSGASRNVDLDALKLKVEMILGEDA